jgi:hypothetical protein
MFSWQETYAAAVLKTGRETLKANLAKTEELMFLRMQELAEQDATNCELEEMTTAWEVINTLRFERLCWPNYSSPLITPESRSRSGAAKSGAMMKSLCIPRACSPVHLYASSVPR